MANFRIERIAASSKGIVEGAEEQRSQIASRRAICDFPLPNDSGK